MEIIQVLTVAGVVVGIVAGTIQVWDAVRGRRDGRRPLGRSWLRRLARRRRAGSLPPAEGAPHPADWIRAATQDAPPLEAGPAIATGPVGPTEPATLRDWEVRLRRHLILPFQAWVRPPGRDPERDVFVLRLVGVRGGTVVAEAVDGDRSAIVSVGELVPAEAGSANDDLLAAYAAWLSRAA